MRFVFIVNLGSWSTRCRETSRTTIGVSAFQDFHLALWNRAIADLKRDTGIARTCGVSELILLALYPILERLGVATGYLNALLNAVRTDIRHLAGRLIDENFVRKVASENAVAGSDGDSAVCNERSEVVNNQGEQSA